MSVICLFSSLQFVIQEVLPFLGDADSVVHREGAIEALACISPLVLLHNIAQCMSDIDIVHGTDPVLHMPASIVVRSHSHNGNYISVSPGCMFFSLTTPSQGLLETVGLDALCYIVLLLMPVLGRMSDQQEEVRHMASRCFAVLVSYMPLEVRYSSVSLKSMRSTADICASNCKLSKCYLCS